MNLFDAGAAFPVDVLLSALPYGVASVSALLVLGVVLYLAMVVGQIHARLHGAARGGRPHAGWLFGRAVMR
jgi:hypothetical protein